MTRRGQYRRTAIMNLAGNMVKFALEGALGFTMGSTALLADAADSLTDLLTNGLAFTLGSRAYEEEDATHPHGHERFEPLAAFIVGFIMVVAGARIGVVAFNGVMSATVPGSARLLLAAAGLALAIKTGLYQYNRSMAAALSSTSLHALAVDARNDMIKSLGVVAGMIAIIAGYPDLEAFVGVMISFVVVYNGITVMKENAAYLVGASPSHSRVEEIQTTLLDDGAVHGVHDLVVHHVGRACEVEVHAEVDGEMSLREAHDIETRLVERLREMDDVADAHVHLDPSGMGEWKEDGTQTF
ncbi:MAG: cation diffusion facilitator family transporter [Candidatus Nanohaloarchaea archaeon]|nr:cation diffusion facilitator family transporter [Candidatus Nanohaloarchaea archaeon]